MMKRTFFFLFCMLLVFFIDSSLAAEEVLYRIEEDGRFGYINRAGEVVVEPQFVEASLFDDYGTALVRHENGLYSLIDHTGSIIITCPEISRNAISYNLYGWHEGFCNQEPFFEGMGLYSPTTKTIVYYTGRILDEPNIDPSSTRVLVADDSDTYGYLDRTTGEMVISLQYESICYDWTQMSDPGSNFFIAYDFAVFHEGYAVAGDENENYFLIDEAGNTLPLPGTPQSNVHEGKLVIRTEKGLQVCTVAGEVISAPYNAIRAYQNGYCGAINGDSEFFILDANGREICHDFFIGHEQFCGFKSWNGYFSITEGSCGEYTQIYHVDKGRLCTIDLEPMAIDYDRELMVINDDHRSVMCKLDGTELYPLPYNSFSPIDLYEERGYYLRNYPYDEYEFFEDGLLRLCTDDGHGGTRYGYLKEDGTWQIPPQFINAEPFRNGLALCTDAEGFYQYIDSDGKVVWKSAFSHD